MNLGKNDSFRIFAAFGLWRESQRISPGGPVDNLWTGPSRPKACLNRPLARRSGLDQKMSIIEKVLKRAAAPPAGCPQVGLIQPSWRAALVKT